MGNLTKDLTKCQRMKWIQLMVELKEIIYEIF